MAPMTASSDLPLRRQSLNSQEGWARAHCNAYSREPAHAPSRTNAHHHPSSLILNSYVPIRSNRNTPQTILFRRCPHDRHSRRHPNPNHLPLASAPLATAPQELTQDTTKHEYTALAPREVPVRSMEEPLPTGEIPLPPTGHPLPEPPALRRLVQARPLL